MFLEINIEVEKINRTCLNGKITSVSITSVSEENTNIKTMMC